MIDGPRIHVRQTVSRDEVVRVRAKIPHPMETGWRTDIHGETVPRNRINRFVCTLGGREVFAADLHSGISADPYVSFFVRVSESGTLACTWLADGGKSFSKTTEITVA